MESIRTGRHCVFELNVHLVFVTKYRKSIFTAPHLELMRKTAGKVCRDFGAELRELDGERDHVHLLVSYPPKVSVSSLVNSLKGVTSRMLRKRFPELENACYMGQLWSPSYFAVSCGEAPREKIKEYVRQQSTPSK